MPKYFHAVYRKPRSKGELIRPLDFIPRRKSLDPAVQFFTYEGEPCTLEEHYYISLPPGFPPPLYHAFIGVFPMEMPNPALPAMSDNDGGESR